MHHAIEEEEKVPMDQVTNFQEVILGGSGEQSVYTGCLADWLLSVACLLCTYWVGCFVTETEDTGPRVV